MPFWIKISVRFAWKNSILTEISLSIFLRSPTSFLESFPLLNLIFSCYHPFKYKKKAPFCPFPLVSCRVFHGIHAYPKGIASSRNRLGPLSALFTFLCAYLYRLSVSGPYCHKPLRTWPQRRPVHAPHTGEKYPPIWGRGNRQSPSAVPLLPPPSQRWERGPNRAIEWRATHSKDETKAHR